MGDFQTILGQLGLVRNPVLFCSTGFSTGMLIYSHDLFIISIAVGVVMYLVAACIFLTGLVFYIYAFLRLPSTTQELIFQREAQATIARHRRSTLQSRQRSADG